MMYLYKIIQLQITIIFLAIFYMISVIQQNMVLHKLTCQMVRTTTTTATTVVKKKPSIKDNTCIRVKITVDGTQVSRSMHILVIAFTILDGSENPNSPGGNHIIALLNSQEKYEYLSEVVKDITSDIKSIKSLTIDGQKTLIFSCVQI